METNTVPYKEVRVRMTTPVYERYLRICEAYDLTPPTLAKAIVMKEMIAMESVKANTDILSAMKGTTDLFEKMIEEEKPKRK